MERLAGTLDYDDGIISRYRYEAAQQGDAEVGGQRVCVAYLRHCAQPSCSYILFFDSNIESEELWIASS
jgi:hypothetical protein